MRDPLLSDLNVSRETVEKLELFAALVTEWTSRINLVSRSTVPSVWERHIIDSVQLCQITQESPWVDVGAGGGFPGIVVAVVLQAKNPDFHMTLVESDMRKAAFLRTAVRTLEASVTVHAKRSEVVDPIGAAVFSARAFAPLDKLLFHAARHLTHGGVAVVPKGRNCKSELAEAERTWSFSYDVVQSVTDESASILKVGNIQER